MPSILPESTPTQVVPARSQTLYRFWDASDRLLYVGISVRPWDRWKQHRGEKPWWEEVVRVTLENFATREEVSSAESAAIRGEGPLYNIAGRSGAADEPRGDDEGTWNGTHAPNPACIGDLLVCSCKEPDWSDPRAATFPCGDSFNEHWERTRPVDANGTLSKGATLLCDECDRRYGEWISDQPFYRPEDYAAHVIGSVLGESFKLELEAGRTPKVRRRPSVKFIADMWPSSIQGDLPRRWKFYAREWIESGLTREEVREAVGVALDAWTESRTDRPWAYLSGITRRMLSDRGVA